MALTGSRLRGGLEMLFADQRRYTLAIPRLDKDGKTSDVAFLIDYLCLHVMQDNRKELFVLDNHLYAVDPSSTPLLCSPSRHASSLRGI